MDKANPFVFYIVIESLSFSLNGKEHMTNKITAVEKCCSPLWYYYSQTNYSTSAAQNAYYTVSSIFKIHLRLKCSGELQPSNARNINTRLEG